MRLRRPADTAARRSANRRASATNHRANDCCPNNGSGVSDGSSNHRPNRGSRGECRPGRDDVAGLGRSNRRSDQRTGHSSERCRASR